MGNCAAMPTANAGQYATSHCKPLLFWFPCKRRYINSGPLTFKFHDNNESGVHTKAAVKCDLDECSCCSRWHINISFHVADVETKRKAPEQKRMPYRLASFAFGRQAALVVFIALVFFCRNSPYVWY